MKFEIIITKPSSAEENMALDQTLLHSLQHDPRCLLHVYEWKSPSLTYGYFINPWEFLLEAGVRRHAIQLAHRPTGGGILFHHCDLAFALLIPATHPHFSANTLDNYALVNERVRDALKSFIKEHTLLLPEEPLPADKSCGQFCMAKPTKYDVMIAGKKVGGGAQRRTKYGLLHQGTIALSVPTAQFLEDVLLPGTCVAEAMRRNSYALMASNQNPNEAREQLKTLLTDAFLKWNN